MKIALGVEYNGKRYFGWQRQEKVLSVQEELEKALSFVANEKIDLFCAGRTDSGVHGTGQVVHFETEVVRPERAWAFGTNANLPDDIAVKWAKTADDEFHARFSATARRYRYLIYTNPLRSAVLPEGVTHCHLPLDHEKMHEAGQFLLGENDFSSFRAAQCQSKTPWRNVHHLQVTRHGRYIVVDIQANAFVHHMVRNIVGSLMEVGSGRQPVEWMKWLLEQRNRKLAAPTAKPQGLYLVRVTYPERFGIPLSPLGPLFLPDELV
ncbi:tRNA pseudouridine(38-40) synthase TruA [Actinobacillus succinogenes]|uniref:tRNA pseudouridine synthase A n=1 Tax=Actinobacillus succinogenes (strain ATCC 55618 / DSM 22257 / CCUG 43843 / 130Z) TaxID=339671 RepID=TRUA_ACTSZ|nr:tRNA pseudouridine(38-40) synthase TruA [Actinobacillus succinogenes]A6VQ16.1 RecName: Full=tRNA pseudouridine synthase A; AltName: Full=tRNA pseudouridine(38-40) synthase; AltName: Full=tRNA pseudouridylate synthase I; AltName: Full=tRNA-uridine isomerase I [Actinobacillus succinogenes 130Z]ABR75063.1 tRNA pseudouridine synthase A [Actinobacillus succinogenes 130Z]PHI40532.1 tRNA pseudouridine(38-40) synthase TruA [Actinobacillus succinogenes]